MGSGERTIFSKNQLMAEVEHQCKLRRMRIRTTAVVPSIVPHRIRKVDFAVRDKEGLLPDLLIECVAQEGAGTACYKFEHFLAEQRHDLANDRLSVIVVTGQGMPKDYQKYMLCQGVVYIEWFGAWLDLYLGEKR